jgi:glutamate racemase
VEEGWEEHDVTRQIAREYLDPVIENEIDTLILGCTHYPMLTKTLKEILPDGINIIDSGVAAANELDGKIQVSSEVAPEHKYFVSDTPERFAELAARFLGKSMQQVYHFDVDRVWTRADILEAPMIV